MTPESIVDTFLYIAVGAIGMFTAGIMGVCLATSHGALFGMVIGGTLLAATLALSEYTRKLLGVSCYEDMF